MRSWGEKAYRRTSSTAVFPRRRWLRDVVLRPGREGRIMTISTVKLTVISAPAIGHILEAPPALTASDNSLDYTCGRCGTILLHADDDQVYGLLIRCSNCGSYNKTAS